MAARPRGMRGTLKGCTRSRERGGVLALLVLPPRDEKGGGGDGGCSLNGNGERSGLPEYLFPATENETTSLK